MTKTQSTIQVLSMLPDHQIDRFLQQLSPKAVEAIKKINQGARQLQDDVAAEIASTVWACLESN